MGEVVEFKSGHAKCSECLIRFKPVNMNNAPRFCSAKCAWEYMQRMGSHAPPIEL